MSFAWRSGAGAGAHRTPVEMRFVDMFMTALGSLIFVALLLVFVVVNFPVTGIAPADSEAPIAGELRLVTKRLMSARAGDAYEAAFAYRGGAGAIRWAVTQGESGMPPGLEFDPAEGVISGVASTVGLYQFTITVTDEESHADTRGYEIEVTPAVVSSKAFNLWVAALLALLELFGFVRFARESLFAGRVAKIAAEEYRRGRTEITFGGRQEIGRDTTIYLPLGIDEFKRQSANARALAILFALGLAGTLGYIAWVLWLS